jgi:hypothetical protein
MWLLIKRWLDWAMHDLWPLYRFGPQSQALRYSYEKAGLTLNDQPIPWNAEAVLVEASMRLPSNKCRKKTDFQIRLSGPRGEPSLREGDGTVTGMVPADQLRRVENEDRWRVSFRLPPPNATVTAELLYKDQHLGQLTLPFLSRDEFVQHLRLQMPTVSARIGADTVACQTFVTSQCKGVVISALLDSPTSLAPLLDLDLQVEFSCERGGPVQRMPAVLCSSQLAGKHALATVVPRKLPRRQGTYTAAWMIGEQVLATQKVRGITQRTFQRSLRISDTRFVSQSKTGGVRLSRQTPPLDQVERLGPCFLVSSGEAGMAGLCHLHIAAQVAGAVQPPLLLEQTVLITDGPTMVAPGTVDMADLKQVSGFEIRTKSRVLGVLSLSPAPAATFTNEGGFKAPQEFTWSAAAEDEMTERLNRLLEGRNAAN